MSATVWPYKPGAGGSSPSAPTSRSAAPALAGPSLHQLGRPLVNRCTASPEMPAPARDRADRRCLGGPDPIGFALRPEVGGSATSVSFGGVRGLPHREPSPVELCSSPCRVAGRPPAVVCGRPARVPRPQCVPGPLHCHKCPPVVQPAKYDKPSHSMIDSFVVSAGVGTGVPANAPVAVHGAVLIVCGRVAQRW